LNALESVYEDADENEKTRLLDLLLDAQRRLADAESQYYSCLVKYMLAIRDVHWQKGSLLDYNEIFLAEGPWPGAAYSDAQRRDRLRSAPHDLSDYRMSRGPIVSQGPYLQDAGAAEAAAGPSPPEGVMPDSASPDPEASGPPIEAVPAPDAPGSPPPPNAPPPSESAAATNETWPVGLPSPPTVR
jgi:hypothetical protein